MIARGQTVAALAALALALAGCGGDEPSAAADRPEPANVDLAEAQTLLEQGGLDLDREALDGEAAIATDVEPSPVASRRLATASGRELDLLVYATPDQARRAWESVLATEVIDEGGAAMRAVNLVVVFPEPAEDGAYARVKQALRRLADACRGTAGDPELRALCFEDEGGVPPAGAGTSLDELAPIGAEVRVGGLAYRVTTARLLNPRIAPDEELVEGLDRPGSGALFGVFLRACNEQGTAARATGRLTVVTAFGERLRPLELPASNPFAYERERVPPDACLPEVGSVAERAADGVLAVFAVPDGRLDERPVGLEIVAPDGTERVTVRLDV